MVHVTPHTHGTCNTTHAWYMYHHTRMVHVSPHTHGTCITTHAWYMYHHTRMVHVSPHTHGTCTCITTHAWYMYHHTRTCNIEVAATPDAIQSILLTSACRLEKCWSVSEAADVAFPDMTTGLSAATLRSAAAAARGAVLSSSILARLELRQLPSIEAPVLVRRLGGT